MTEATEGGRRRRADAGQIRATERDSLGMAWVADMYGMPFDLLRQLLGVTDSALWNVVSRWRQAGWVETGRIGGEPLVSWVWATRLGCETFGARPYTPNRPSAGSLNHHRAAILVRMQLAEQLGDRMVEYRSERELRWELGTLRGSDAARAHLPDGVASYTSRDGATVGTWVIEVELTPKAADRIEKILDALFDQYRGPSEIIAYYVSAQAAPIVRRAKEAYESRAPKLGNRLRIHAVPGEEI